MSSSNSSPPMAPSVNRPLFTKNFDSFPGVKYTFPIERDFNMEHAYWFEHHWHRSFYYSLFYVVVIVWFGLKVMKPKDPFVLRLPLGFWNLALCLFSAAGTVRLLPWIWHEIQTDGFFGAICNGKFKEDKRTLFWLTLFMWSKVLEFGDTFFIILRKQKLIFLHWYHHWSTLVFCFLCMSSLDAPGIWFAGINFAIHTLMYGYYTIRAFRLFKVPQAVNMMITTLQIVQMFIGLAINMAHVYNSVQSNPVSCHMPFSHSLAGLTLYMSFALLFGNFFYHTYLKKGPSPTKSSALNGSAKKIE